MNVEDAVTPKTPLHISRATAAAALVPRGSRSAELLRHGTLKLRLLRGHLDRDRDHAVGDGHVLLQGAQGFVPVL